jgi:hypothetical protein
MKMKIDHYELLSKVIRGIMTVSPNLKDNYIKQGLSKERFAWDMLWKSGFSTPVLYDYLNDSHIQTALFRIIGDYHEGGRS